MKKGNIWKIIVGVAAIIGGILLIAITLYTRESHSYTIIGGADGPTSIFLAGKVGLGSMITAFIGGTVLFVSGVLCIIFRNKEKQK